MGRGYVIEHCVSFFQKETRQKSYQVYVTDLLMGIARANGLKIDARFKDIVDPVEVDEAEADNIISNIRKKLGGGEK